MSAFTRLATAASLAFVATAGPATAEISFTGRFDQALPGRGPAAIVAADMLGDASIDIVVTFAASGEVAILENDGTGAFSLADPGDLLSDPDAAGSPTQISAVSDDPGGVQVVDLNGDGRLDVVGVNRMGTPRFFSYLNNADLSVDPGGPRWIPSDMDASGGEGFDLTVTDWPNPADTFPDLVIATATGQVKIVLGRDGTGDFDTRLIFSATGEVGVLTDIKVADLIRSDPMLDILTVDNNLGQLVIWPGDPTLPGSLLDDQLVFVPTEVDGETVLPIEAFVEDFDSDMIPDALVVTESGHVLFFAGDESASVFAAPVITDLVAPLSADPATRMPTTFTSASLADVNGDGTRDLLVADAGDRGATEGFNWFSTYYGCPGLPIPTFDPDGSTCGLPSIHHASADLAPDRPFGIAAAQFDGQPGLEVAVLNGDASNLTLHRNDGSGAFLDAARSYSVGGATARGLDVTDFDGDGFADAAVGVVGLATVTTLRGDGLGGFQQAVALPGSGATNPSTVILESFAPEIDSDFDIIATFNSEHAFWQGSGASFTAPMSIPITGFPRTGDVGGSSALDLVTARNSPSGHSVARWINSGTGTFSDEDTWDNFFGFTDHAVGRFFGSSRADIVVFARASATPTDREGIWIIRHDGASDSYSDPVFQAFEDVDPVLGGFFSVRSSAVGDLDGDGRDELVVAAGNGLTLVFEPNGMGGFQLAPGSEMGIDLAGAGQSLLLADLNGDFDLDLIGAARGRVVVVEGTVGSRFLDAEAIALPTNIANDRVRAGDLTGDGLPELIVSSSATSDLTVFINRSVPPLRLFLGRPAPPETLYWLDVGDAAYDIVRGDLWALRSTESVDAASMLACDLATTEVSDPDPPPAAPATPPGAWPAWYYLLRCEGLDCVDPTYGTDSMGSIRVVGAGDCP